MAYSKADTIMIDRAYLIILTTVEGTIYGITFALYILCVWSLHLQLGDRTWRRQHLFTLLCMSLLMAFALCGLAADAQNAQASYVDHADYPSGGRSYSINIFGKSPVATLSYAATVLVSFMTSAIQIWRLWIVWRVSRYSLFIVILLVLCLLAYLGLEAVAIASRGWLGMKKPLGEIIYYGAAGFPLSISIIVTLLITTRIAGVRRTHIKLMGETDSSSSYTSLISMFIESFALECVWMIGALGTSFSTSNLVELVANDFLLNTMTFIQVLAYLLVVHRVAMSRGWEKDTEKKLTTLQWNRDELQSTQICTQGVVLIAPKEV